MVFYTTSGANAGFVNVGTDHDTGAFAVASIRGWWHLKTAALSECGHDSDHSRWWGEQWIALETMEVGIAEVC